MNDEWIAKLERFLPERCTPEDLVKFGLFRSAQAACGARKYGVSPSFYKLGHRIIYLREDVINWMRSNKHESGEKSGEACSAEPA
jgi:hypothetical protein